MNLRIKARYMQLFVVQTSLPVTFFSGNSQQNSERNCGTEGISHRTCCCARI